MIFPCSPSLCRATEAGTVWWPDTVQELTSSLTISDVLGELDGVDDGGQEQGNDWNIFILNWNIFTDKESLTGDNESVDGHTVVFVLLVGVRAPQAEACQEGPEEIKEKSDDHQSSSATDVAWK